MDETEARLGRFISVCAVIACLGLFSVMGYGCQAVEQAQTEQVKYCTEAHGTYLARSGNCIVQR